MSNIKSHYIDFRSEHRIYFLDGMLHELVGMCADTDYDDWSEDSYSTNSSPRTRYKLIFDPEQMYNGGYYEEGSLPYIFAHRGDTLTHPMLSKILLNNIYYNIDDPICILETLSRFDLHIDMSKPICDITVRLCDIVSGYRVETNIHSVFGYPLTFIHYPTDGQKGIIFTIDGNEKLYTFKRLATAIGKIIFTLRSCFDRDVEIVNFHAVRFEDTPKEEEIALPEAYDKFLRLINIAAEQERRYWEKYKT